ncbi:MULTISPECIES: alpha/beta hydrolase [Leptospira]|uniref:Putative lysophospholipase n=4 Tax=Leptospira weilii TaxID=28184 RepID=A0A828Z717_9LEPT|nr:MULTISPECIES: alpha/beta hydrolase [Leptospira]EMM71871.1 putative lysophospholipase [Leptospira weilii str. 2006001855]EMY12093.1 putative lysophospholipase [Leptospira weilii str. Ecochallenge]EKR65752.1 putative lysophospholipase [Leptospira weilii str. 2006001853]EMJ65670.1 putative lysophospholipase [Leptospira sp. P2653]EMN45814.1 putative lysophospholipase [Leptospira weilii str. LNT 1234]
MKIGLGIQKIQSRSRRIVLVVSFLVFLSGVNSISAAYEREILTYNLVGRGFNVLETTYYKINVVHYRKPSGGPIIINGKTVLFVHGFGDNSAFFEPLAKELINQGKATHVYIMDLPGHGASTMTRGTAPAPANVSQLSVGNYGDALRALLNQMVGTEKRKITTIVGHSIGGLVIQMIQSRFRDGGSSLLDAFGIENTILIASDIPSALPWFGADAPITDPNSAKGFVWSFKTEKVVETQPFPPQVITGFFVETPDDFYINTKFAVNGVPVTGAPTPAQLEVMSNLEPYTAAANIVGLDPSGQTTNAVSRLSVSPNIWNGFNLKVVWLDKGVFFNQSETEGLAQYLKAGSHAITVSDAEAVHGAPFSKPSLFLSLF